MRPTLIIRGTNSIVALYPENTVINVLIEITDIDWVISLTDNNNKTIYETSFLTCTMALEEEFDKELIEEVIKDKDGELHNKAYKMVFDRIEKALKEEPHYLNLDNVILEAIQSQAAEERLTFICSPVKIKKEKELIR